MNRFNYLFIFLILIPFSLHGQKSNILVIEIADFYHFKNGAISLTFDDGVPNQFSIGREVLDKFNFKGTFFIITEGANNWDIIRDMVKDGHEIGSHTLTHPKLTEISLEDIRRQMEQSKIEIESNIKDYQCISFSYPNGLSNENIRQYASKVYQGARSTNGGYVPPEISYYFKLPSFVLVSNTKLDFANKLVDSAIHNNSWLIETFHGFDNQGYEPVSSNLFLDHLQYIKSKEDYLWVTTFGNAIRYFKERQSAKIELIDSSFNYYKLNVTDDLPDSIYDFPLTMRIKIPDQWTQIKVLQNNINVNFQLQSDVCNNQYVVFDAIPDRGEITITSEKVATLDSANCNYCNPVAFPNPFNQTLSVLSGPLIKGTIHIYGSSGACIFNGELDSERFKIDTSAWSKGVYIIMIKLNNSSKIIKRIVVKQ